MKMSDEAKIMHPHRGAIVSLVARACHEHGGIPARLGRKHSATKERH
jgi:hypothetical protein